MGLLGILRKVKARERELRILVLGLDNAGKSSIVKRLCGEDVSELSPTLGFQIYSLDYELYTLHIWDVGGQSTIRAYWRNYFEQTDGLIWVVDSADSDRLHLCKSELEVLLNEERLSAASLLILANKQDLDGALSAIDISTLLGLNVNHQNSSDSNEHAALGDRHWRVEPCSAFSSSKSEIDDRLLNAFEWLVQDMGSRVYVGL
mmetsp:Transcript_10019/g.18043  ORF Transcript_10019/g.18043 Transcript_10019/m.18043 type:complete len:204 (-) Transcript_10019:1419-2030(-)